MSNDLYLWYKQHGICVICGCRDAIPGIVRCKECKSIFGRYSAEHYANRMAAMTDEERKTYFRIVSKRSNESRRILKEIRYSEGLCVYCGKRKFAPGLKSCEICRRKHNAKAAAYYKSHYAKKPWK